MSLFSHFKTDQNLEQNGFDADYGDFKLKLRRSGGSNKRYAAAFQTAMKPWKTRDIDREDIQVRRDLMTQVFVEACIVEYSWKTKQADGSFVDGIEDESGAIVPATIANVVRVLKQLPDLEVALSREASDMDRFLTDKTKETVENLPLG
jgi:hypothetical protein